MDTAKERVKTNDDYILTIGRQFNVIFKNSYQVYELKVHDKSLHNKVNNVIKNSMQNFYLNDLINNKEIVNNLINEHINIEYGNWIGGTIT